VETVREKSKTNAVITTTTTISDTSMNRALRSAGRTPRPLDMNPRNPGDADLVEGASPVGNERAAPSGIGEREQ
jgi:hypothetical protein